jgi:hypothetical protein
MERRVYVGGKCIGKVIDGVFPQNITDRHIFRELNAKGMDINLHTALKGICDVWRLTHKKTGQVLSIPFEKIEAVAIKKDTGAGVQLMVPLAEFNEDRPVVQGSLL